MNNSPDSGDGCSPPSHLNEEADPEPSRSHGTFLDEKSSVSLLSQILKTYSPRASEVDLRDDCAFVPHSNTIDSNLTLVTTDALCEGVHFDLHLDQLKEVGRQAVIANVSDLASSGAKPSALLWSLSVPHGFTKQNLKELATGFAMTAAHYDCSVIGGNLCVREGPLELHVTAMGVPWGKAILRNGAQAGDAVYVTGTLGERALGYLDPTKQHRALRHEWRAHTLESQLLSDWGYVTSMMDISDGLLLDAERLAIASQLQINLWRDALPASEIVTSHPKGEQAILSGGEDYILLFTASSHTPPPIEANATLIGKCLNLDQSGTALSLDRHPITGVGYQHFLQSDVSSSQ